MTRCPQSNGHELGGGTDSSHSCVSIGDPIIFDAEPSRAGQLPRVLTAWFPVRNVRTAELGMTQISSGRDDTPATGRRQRGAGN
jgi:hypothetical protein